MIRGGRLAIVALGAVACRTSAVEGGRALFEGRGPPLVAHIAGQDSVLPAIASRCSNCHRPDATADGGFGPDLFGESLTSVRARRAGPPSRFDRDSLCRLLRTGVDAADVIIAHEMPRYELSEAQCGLLWTYLTQATP